MRKITKHLFWLLLLACLTMFQEAGSAAIIAPSHDYAVRPLGIDMGLSSNYCVAIERDKWGYLWIATEEGLNRFDGSHFYTYYQYLSPGFRGDALGSNALSALLDDAHRPVMWVATQRNGLNAIDYENYSIRHYIHQPKDDHSIGSNDLTGLARASDGGSAPIGTVLTTSTRIRDNLLTTADARCPLYRVTRYGARSTADTASFMSDMSTMVFRSSIHTLGA